MFLTVEEKEQETIISFNVDLIEQNLDRLFIRSCKIIKESNSFLFILDLKYVERLDSYGLGLLLNLGNCVYKLNKQIKIVNIDKKLFDKFKSYKIDKRYECSIS